MSLASALQPLQALAHETRWRIVELLLQEPMCVAQLTEVLQLRQSNVSNHLQVIRRAGLVVCTRRRGFVQYRIADRYVRVIPLWRDHLGISLAADVTLSADAWNSQGKGR